MDVSQEMEVSWLLSSFFKLAVADRMLLVKELNRTGLNDGRAVVLRFAPELLRNCLASAIGSANKGLPSHQIVEGIMQGLSILVDLFYAAREKVFSSPSPLQKPTYCSSFFMCENLPQVKEIQLRGSGIYFVGCHQISTWASDCSALQKVRFCLENNEDSNEGTVFVIESKAGKKNGGNTRALRQFEYAASKLQAIFRGNTTRFCDCPP